VTFPFPQAVKQIVGDVGLPPEQRKPGLFVEQSDEHPPFPPSSHFSIPATKPSPHTV